MKQVSGYVYAPSPSWSSFIGMRRASTDSPPEFSEAIIPFPTLEAAYKASSSLDFSEDDADCGVDILRISLSIPESIADLQSFAQSKSLVLIARHWSGSLELVGPVSPGFSSNLHANLHFFPDNMHARFQSLAEARRAETAVTFLDRDWCVETRIARLRFRIVGGDSWDELLEKRWVAKMCAQDPDPS